MIKNTNLGGTDWSTPTARIKPTDLNDTFDEVASQITDNKADADRDIGLLGEVRQFALSISGAVTKATLQGKGWAICDGTTPDSQGISSATITTTPNLEDKFLKMSNDETSGTTGGSETHNHQWAQTEGGARFYTYNSAGTFFTSNTNEYTSGANGGIGPDDSDADLYTKKVDGRPPFYELVFFIKVKNL